MSQAKSGENQLIDSPHFGPSFVYFTITFAAGMAPQRPDVRELSAPLPPSPPAEISTSAREKELEGGETLKVATLEGDDEVDEEEGDAESEEQGEGAKDDAEVSLEPGVHKGQDDWTAVWSPECVFLPADDAECF